MLAMCHLISLKLMLKHTASLGVGMCEMCCKPIEMVGVDCITPMSYQLKSTSITDYWYLSVCDCVSIYIRMKDMDYENQLNEAHTHGKRLE